MWDGLPPLAHTLRSASCHPHDDAERALHTDMRVLDLLTLAFEHKPKVSFLAFVTMYWAL